MTKLPDYITELKTEGDTVTVHFNGSIDETTQFSRIGDIPQTVRVFLKAVHRINSEGVRSWVEYFESVNQKGKNIELHECSTAIVEQLNLISNFSCGAKIISIYVPFICEKCGKELLGLFKMSDFNPEERRLPRAKCIRCQGDAVFDDIWDEYFRFALPAGNTPTGKAKLLNR